MAMRQMARSMAARVFAAGERWPSFSETGSRASTRRSFCSREELPKELPKELPREPPKHPLYAHLPPRRESIWAEMKEWLPLEKFAVAFGSVTLPFMVFADVDFCLIMWELWRYGGLQSTDPSWDEED